MTSVLEPQVDAAGVDAITAVAAVTAVASKGPKPRRIRIGATSYPVFLPNIRDSRLHVAMVVMTIHALGQTVLHFRVSAVQILAAILTCFVIEIGVVFGKAKEFRWPASAMLTGSGVGLIMRLPDMTAGHPWSTYKWWMYSAVAGGSLITKYVIRDRGRHVFNPSNLGLMFVFLVLGSHFAEPLDFWWAPVNPFMLFAYAMIIVGGSLVSRRVGLLPMAGTFAITLAVGLGAIALSGHSIYSPSSLHPVSGWHFWWLVITSPETLIFVYFMLSDPKTVPKTPGENMLFGFTVAALAVALIAPQKTEFGTKVALLGALTICSALRAVVKRSDNLRTFLTARPFNSVTACVSAMVTICALIVGVGARPLGEVVDGSSLRAVPKVDSFSLLPVVTVSTPAGVFDPAAAANAQQLGNELVRILATERAALGSNHPEWLPAVSYGRRLDEITAKAKLLVGQPTRTASAYSFDSLQLVVIPSRSEGANRLGFDASGTVSETEFNADGTTIEVNPHPFKRFFVLRRATDRWLLVDELSQETQTRTSLQ
jgi:hypothetical protein